MMRAISWSISAPLLAVAALAADVAAGGQERRTAALAKVHATHPAHAKIHHHAASNVAGTLQIVLSAGRNVVEDHLFRERSGQQHLDAAFQLGLSHQIAVPFGTLHDVTERAMPRGMIETLCTGSVFGRL